MNKVLEICNIDESTFDNINKETTEFIHGYYNFQMNTNIRENYMYLNNLDPELETYCEFGVDSCSVSDFRSFCDELNVDISENLVNHIKLLENCIYGYVRHIPIHRILRKYEFYSRDYDLTFTVNSNDFMSGYFHYFGITGEKSKVLKAFDYITKYGDYTDISWGKRQFI
jgi:hypothetical protein